MSKALVEESSLYAVASAIRQKGGSGQYKPGEMAAAVLALPGPSTLISKSITANGSFDPDDDNADGYSGVTVNVPNSYAAGDEGKVVQSGALVAQTSATKTANGTYDTTLNNEIVVNVPSAAPDLGTKTITENGTYAAEDDSLDGYSEVTVNVSGGGGMREAWDFTAASPFVGKLLGLGFFEKTGVAASAGGAVIDASSDRLVFAGSANGMTIEADVAATNLTDSNNRRFVMADTTNGLVYRNTGAWGFYAGSWEMTEETNGDFFANSTVKVVIDSAGYWHIYKDDVLWFEPEAALPLGATVQIGSNSYSCVSVTITGLRIRI